MNHGNRALAMLGHERQVGQKEVTRAFADLLAAYSACNGPLSAWESHCMELALAFCRHGYFDKALIKIVEILEPPYPLPAFAEPPSLAVDDARRHMSALGGEGD